MDLMETDPGLAQSTPFTFQRSFSHFHIYLTTSTWNTSLLQMLSPPCLWQEESQIPPVIRFFSEPRSTREFQFSPSNLDVASHGLVNSLWNSAPTTLLITKYQGKKKGEKISMVNMYIKLCIDLSVLMSITDHQAIINILSLMQYHSIIDILFHHPFHVTLAHSQYLGQLGLFTWWKIPSDLNGLNSCYSMALLGDFSL